VACADPSRAACREVRSPHLDAGGARNVGGAASEEFATDGNRGRRGPAVRNITAHRHPLLVCRSAMEQPPWTPIEARCVRPRHLSRRSSPRRTSAARGAAWGRTDAPSIADRRRSPWSAGGEPWVANGPDIGSWRLLTAAPARVLPPSAELARSLTRLPHRSRSWAPGRSVAARGVGRGRGRVRTWRGWQRGSDPEGSEAARLRAFGLVHNPRGGGSRPARALPGSSTSSTAQTVSRAPAGWPDHAQLVEEGVATAPRAAFPTGGWSGYVFVAPCPRPRRRLQRGSAGVVTSWGPRPRTSAMASAGSAPPRVFTIGHAPSAASLSHIGSSVASGFGGTTRGRGVAPPEARRRHRGGAGGRLVEPADAGGCRTTASCRPPAWAASFW
jgi:hypothetical protein